MSSIQKTQSSAQSESKSAKKKKAKAEAAAPTPNASLESEADGRRPSDTNGADVSYESPYLKELHKYVCSVIIGRDSPIDSMSPSGTSAT